MSHQATIVCLLVLYPVLPSAAYASDNGGAVTLADSVGNCFDCVLGLYDDLDMTKNMGTMLPGVSKDIYLGIQFGSGYSDLTGIEFSVAGMRFEEDGIILLAYSGVTPISDISWYLPQAPADTSSTSSEAGGMLVLWHPLLFGDRPLIKFTLLSYSPPTDHLLRVKRKYPTSNPQQWQTPVLIQNRGTVWPVARISGGCYVLNWSGDPNVGCDIITSVEESTWSAMKQLYR